RPVDQKLSLTQSRQMVGRRSNREEQVPVADSQTNRQSHLPDLTDHLVKRLLGIAQVVLRNLIEGNHGSIQSHRQKIDAADLFALHAALELRDRLENARCDLLQPSQLLFR